MVHEYLVLVWRRPATTGPETETWDTERAHTAMEAVYQVELREKHKYFRGEVLHESVVKEVIPKEEVTE